MNINYLADKILFAKEAADYLGISVQRLNQLIHEGKIVPVKKTASGTLFHIDELNKRKEELSIFDSGSSKGGGKGMFEINSQTKQEAVNFATLMILLNCTESKAEPEFENISNSVEIHLPIDDSKVLFVYSNYLKMSEQKIIEVYRSTLKSFSRLHQSDEIIKRGSPDYPPLLAQTEQAPRFLYIRGKKSLLFETRTVSLVGSRNASDTAKDNTRKIAKMLGENGITVISGLAKGIDVSAHRSALDYGYNTIAVVGTSLNQYYPSENMQTQKEIEEKGLVVSQFSPASKTQRWFFPLRNGVMSGLSLATIIIEAGETSGALKQADFALKQGRQLLIPISVYENKAITWPKKYVEKGAQVVHNSFEIISVLAENNIFKLNNNRILTTKEKIQQSIEDIMTNQINTKNDMNNRGKSVISIE